jgi:Flp pilus assembly protein TadG
VRRKRLLSDSSGATAVEFALVATPLLLLILGVLDFGRLYWSRNQLEFAAEEAGRYAMANHSATMTEITNYAKSRLAGLDPSAVTATAATDTADGITFVTVALSYQFQFIPFVTYVTPTLTGRSRVPFS